MDGAQSVQASSEMMHALLKEIATAQMELAEKIVKVDVETQLKLSEEAGKGEAIDILI